MVIGKDKMKKRNQKRKLKAEHVLETRKIEIGVFFLFTFWIILFYQILGEIQTSDDPLVQDIADQLTLDDTSSVLIIALQIAFIVTLVELVVILFLAWVVKGIALMVFNKKYSLRKAYNGVLWFTLFFYIISFATLLFTTYLYWAWILVLIIYQIKLNAIGQ